MPDTSEPAATVAGQSIALHLTGYPDIPNRWGPGHIRPTGIRLDYGSLHTPDTRRATVFGLWIREDGQATDEPLDRDYYAPNGDLSNWPPEIADLAKKHQPSTVTPPDRADVPPAGQAALRDRIELAIHSELTEYRLGLDTGMIVQRLTDAMLRLLPPSGDRDALERVRAVLETEAVVGRSALEYRGLITFALMADEAQQPEAPWATDGARIGRVLIWSWADVGDTDFGQGYRTAQEDVRAILTRPLLGAETPESEPQPVRRAPGKAILCPDCSARGDAVCTEAPE